MPEDSIDAGDDTISHTQHAALDDELRGQLCLYTLGMLDPAEAQSYQAHVKSCVACAEEVRADSELITTLAVSESERIDAAPPAGMRGLLLEKIAAEPHPGVHPFIVRTEEGIWKKVLPGIEVKRLFFDPIMESVTSLVRVAAGAVYPAHVHRGLEHLYVLDGEIVFDDHRLSTGDYEVRTPDTQHSSATTAPGEDCLLLVVNCERDEFIF